MAGSRPLLMRAFLFSALFAALYLCSAVSAEDGKKDEKADTTTTAPNSTTTQSSNSAKALIFPLVCGLAGVPIFAFVIAAAIYQPFYTKKRSEKRMYEIRLEEKKRHDSNTEKFRELKRHISLSSSDEKEKEALKGGVSNV